MLTLKYGNIFNTKAQTIVNTVNCVGVMGAGIAYEFRLRYPQMFEKYRTLCDPNNPNRLEIGKLWLYQGNDRLILNFPTKTHWKMPSKMEYIELGLAKFTQVYKQKGITSVAFPMLGAQNGGLNGDEVKQIMIKFLEPLDIECEIWGFDPDASDDLYDKFVLNFNPSALKAKAKKMGLKNIKFNAIASAIESGAYHSLSSLLMAPGIGDKSLEACFRLAMSEPKGLF